MTDRKLMQQAFDALESDCDATKFGASEALRARLAQPEPDDGYCQACEGNHCTAKNGCVALDNPRAQPEPEPLWIRNEEGKLELQVPLHFLDPAKVARLIDEAFERGKKEIDMEQVKDIAQKLADCALLNSAPPQPKQEPVAWMHDSHVGFNVPLYTASPQREWQTLTENEIKHLWYEACQTNLELTSQLIVHLARNIEAKLKEKNNA